MKESETHFLLDLDYNAYKFFLSEAHFYASHTSFYQKIMSTES